MTDRKKLYLISSVTLTVLLLTLFVPTGRGRVIAAILLLPLAVISYVNIKKRVTPSIFHRQVLLLFTVIGLLYLVFYYVSILKFGYTKTGYGFRPEIIWGFIIPIAVIIVSVELIRYVLCSQSNKWGKVFAFAISLLSDLVICSTIPALTNISAFMEFIGLALLPGLTANLLYNYVTVRYGFLPNLVYKALTVWAFYLIPYGSGISNLLVGLFDLVLPIIIYAFISALYEKKKKYALGNTSVAVKVISIVLTVAVYFIMLGTVMIVSNQFKYGAYVVATPSMTGELNQGDIAIFEKIDDQPITEGQVIVFEKDGIVIIHRVVDIETVNGTTRYYTKGDANEDLDAGFIVRSNVIGFVNLKLPYFGYPTIWMRNMFK